jgi:hypothetical protein
MHDLRIAGRALIAADLDFIRAVIAERATWSRWALSRELTRRLGWLTPTGQLKDMACRELLVKLDRLQLVTLPPPRRVSPSLRGRCRPAVEVACDQTPVVGILRAVQPVQVEVVARSSADDRLIRWLLASHHYLGLNRMAGATLRYALRAADGRMLGCALWASAAWKTNARDQWIGWSSSMRAEHLQKIVNNTRFLVLPWVQVPHLASHVLGIMARRISADWRTAYGSEVVLAETFVDDSRYAGTCYKAAGWKMVGQTAGRTRDDRSRRISVPRKSVWMKPLCVDWQTRLMDSDRTLITTEV